MCTIYIGMSLGRASINWTIDSLWVNASTYPFETSQFHISTTTNIANILICGAGEWDDYVDWIISTWSAPTWSDIWKKIEEMISHQHSVIYWPYPFYTKQIDMLIARLDNIIFSGKDMHEAGCRKREDTYFNSVVVVLISGICTARAIWYHWGLPSG